MPTALNSGSDRGEAVGEDTSSIGIAAHASCRTNCRKVVPLRTRPAGFHAIIRQNAGRLKRQMEANQQKAQFY